jgi:hypothetical protein
VEAFDCDEHLPLPGKLKYPCRRSSNPPRGSSAAAVICALSGSPSCFCMSNIDDASWVGCADRVDRDEVDERWDKGTGRSGNELAVGTKETIIKTKASTRSPKVSMKAIVSYAELTWRDSRVIQRPYGTRKWVSARELLSYLKIGSLCRYMFHSKSSSLLSESSGIFRVGSRFFVGHQESGVEAELG